MGHRYDCLLIPSASGTIIDVFRTFRPQRPLQLSKLDQRLVGISGHGCGCVPSDYEQLAAKLCPLAGAAVILNYNLNGGGWRYQIYEKRRAIRTLGPTWETGECDAEVWELLKVTVDEVESRLLGDEIVCLNFPLIAEVLQRIPEAEFADCTTSSRARLIRLSETVDRLILGGQPDAAARLLRDLGNQLDSVLIQPAHQVVHNFVEVRLESLNSGPSQ